MDRLPAAAGRGSCLILDRFVHRTDRDVEDEADGTASKICYTCTGRPIRASLRLAKSPAVSRLYLDWPSRPEFGGRLREPHVIAAHDHSILFRAIVPLEGRSCKDTRNFPVDLFVYSAFSSPPSLHRLPTCFIGGFSIPDEDIYFKPHRRQQQRTMVEEEIGLLCHGSKGGFAVVDFTSMDLEGGELCLLHHDALPASASHNNTEDADWMIKKVQLPPAPGLSIRRWITDAIIPLNGRYLCWVDNYQGILVVDVLRASDKDQLLHYIPLPDDALQSDCRSYPDGDCPDAARCVCVTQGMLTLVCITTHKAYRAPSPFTITSWTLPDFPRSEQWHRRHTMKAEEFWGLYDGHSLPRVKPMYPLVSLVNLDEFCFLLEDHMEKDRTTYWIIEVNMWNKMFKSSAVYINEEEEGCTTDRPRRIIFDGHSFIPSRLSNYLGMAAIKSLELSEMMQKVKQSRVARKKSQLEVEQSKSKEHVAESKAAKCRA